MVSIVCLQMCRTQWVEEGWSDDVIHLGWLHGCSNVPDLEFMVCVFAAVLIVHSSFLFFFNLPFVYIADALVVSYPVVSRMYLENDSHLRRSVCK